MSTMTMKLPQTYVDVEKEEMQYLDGGWGWNDAKNLVIAAIAGAVTAIVGKSVSASLVGLAIQQAGWWLTAAINAWITFAVANPGAALVIGSAVIMCVTILGRSLGYW